MSLLSLNSIFQVMTSLIAGLTAIRILYSGLYKRYPILLPYMAFLSLYGLAPFFLDNKGAAYFWTWLVCTPIQWTLEILLVRELCRVVLERHPGLITLGRWVMYLGVLVAAVLSFVSLLPHISASMSARSKVLGYWNVANRELSVSLVIFLLLMLLAVSRYPVRLSRNVVMNAVLFTLTFMCDSVGAVLRALFDINLDARVGVCLAATEVLCLLVWLFFLTPQGETAHLDWIHFGADYERRVLGHLDALSQVMQRKSFKDINPVM